MRLPFFSLVVLAALPSFASDVTGQFTVDGKPPIKPKYAAAYAVRDQRDARKWQVEVVLSEEAMDVASAVAELDPHTNAINQKALSDHNYILLWVSPDGKVSMNATYTEGMVQYIDKTEFGSLAADLKENGADRISGRIYTPKPVKTMDGDAYNVDVTFVTPVARPAAGKAVAKDGDAAKAYLAFADAIEKKSWAGLQKGMTKERFASYNEDWRSQAENLESAVDILKARGPKGHPKVTAAEQRGDTVILDVEGDLYEGRRALWQVTMVKEDGHWAYEDAGLAGLLAK